MFNEVNNLKIYRFFDEIVIFLFCELCERVHNTFMVKVGSFSVYFKTMNHNASEESDMQLWHKLCLLQQNHCHSLVCHHSDQVFSASEIEVGLISFVLQ